jgi:hypothetical protein
VKCRKKVAHRSWDSKGCDQAAAVKQGMMKVFRQIGRIPLAPRTLRPSMTSRCIEVNSK